MSKEIDESLKDYENYSLDDLRKLKAIKQLGEKIVIEPTSKIEMNGDSKQVYGDDVDVELISWAKENSLVDYEHIFINTDSDASCPDDYADWTPTEYFSSYILAGVATNCELFKLSKVKVNLGAGNGDKVVFRTVGARTATGDLGGCDCISCTSTSWGKHEVTVKRFADNDIVCEFDSWQSLGTKEAELKEMKKGAIRYVDSEIFDAIDESTPGFNVDTDVAIQCSDTSPSGSCCTIPSGQYIYRAVIDLLTDMREGNYDPDALLMSPSVAAFFKYKDAIDIPFIMRNAISLDASGRLVELGGVKVVECNHMSACSDLTGQILVYAIQSDRSVGIVWGKQPAFYNIYRGDCDSWSVGYNAYFGVDSLDDQSIGTVSNP